ncbi:extracellular solute-binding protein [Arabiibacter massiliensis]|uniref:extracellular solute-binding protein n=1 Tax=Arabiibacter massiliensis TaxID=1870985 RepID=UPI0009B9C5C3|nr:extracellular solute-binding protein [Arabiibacter massiliensis]
MRSRGSRTVRLLAALACAGALLCAGCASGAPASPEPEDVDAASLLDPGDPVQVELWTYYNGAQQQAFESLVKEFNETRGKDVGVVATHASQGGVEDLAAAVTDAAEGRVGASAMPDAFLSYADTAYALDNMGKVADLSGYLSDEEKSQFVESFLAEGDLAGDGSLKVFPVCKSTETLQINLTDWQKFAEATGATLDDLATVEGVTRTAQRYYEWTDAATPEPGDGRPFFGRDALANYLVCGSRQLGHDILNVQDGSCAIELDRATMRALWDNYYVPLVQGWFSAEGRFRSDAVKTGGLVCYAGSSTSVVYFPQDVTVDDATSYPIEFGSLPSPVFEGGVACSPQQGAGFVVAKADAKTEAACVEFLKWFTDGERNVSFSVAAGYLPVKKDLLERGRIEELAADVPNAPVNYLTGLPAALDTVNAGVYATAPFAGGVEARAVLEHNLADKASADVAAIEEAMAGGTVRAEAAAAYLADENFDAWLADMGEQLEAATKQG